MDKMLNSKSEQDTIYEIYRACRLCGGGAGYKMPIIQNIVDLDEADVELKQKIRDCVQIEVHQDDKMPPLICELCVDKVNDFYEFLEMCRQTNKRTRLRLGLPPQSLPRGAPDAGDCILGLTEPVFVNEDSDAEALSKHKRLKGKVVKKEPIVRVKIEKLQDEHIAKQINKGGVTPQRITRHSKSKDEDVTFNCHKDTPRPSKGAPKSILKKEMINIKSEQALILPSGLKRLRDKEPGKSETPAKKVKITTKSPPPPPPPPISKPKSSPKTSPRLMPKTKPLRSLRSPVTSPPKRPTSPPPKETFNCLICGHVNKSSQARSSHMRVHDVVHTSPKMACNPCEEWFSSSEEYTTHHKGHKLKHIPYTCWKCQTDFKFLFEYDLHLVKNECVPSCEVPDLKCVECWHPFPTYNLLDTHNCLGEDHRPGGKCSKCNRNYALLKNLRKHESTCTAKKKGELIVDKHLLGQLKPIQVRIARCDSLLTNVKQERYDVSTVSPKYGLDRNCYYPYISSIRIKTEFPGMVKIHDEIKNEFCSEDYIHWDSDESDDDVTCDAILNPTTKKKVDSLSTLSLKTIFSHRFLGKVPKKKRKVKIEKAFDSMLVDNDDVRLDIDNIINNLGDDNDKSDTCGKSDSSFDLLTSYSQGAVNFNQDLSNNSNDISNNDNLSSNDNAENNSKNDSNKIDDKLVNDTNTINNNSTGDEELINNKDINHTDVTSENGQNSIDNVDQNDSKSVEKESNDKQNSDLNNLLLKVNNGVQNNKDLKEDKDDSNTINNKKAIINENSDSNNDNDKIALEDLITKSADSNIGLGSIEDYCFDS